jgi:isoleucyl-tRNA synthetase
MFARTNPSDNMLFGYKIADEVRRRFHLKLWNVYNFFVTYANLDAWHPVLSTKYKVQSTKNVLDSWITSRLNQTVEIVTNSLDKFDAQTATAEIERFVDDLSLWYVRRSRDRVGPAAESEKDKNAFYHTTYYVLHTTAKLLAPFTPYLSDFIYTNLTKEKSVHLTDWPMINAKKIDAKLIEEMATLRQIVETAHAIRKEKAIPVKQALNSYSTKQKAVSKNLEYLLRDEINVKEVVWGAKTDKFDTTITKELEEEMRMRDLVRKIQDERKNLGLTLTDKVNVSIEEIPTNKKLLEFLVKKTQIKSIKQGKFKVSNV